MSQKEVIRQSCRACEGRGHVNASAGIPAEKSAQGRLSLPCAACQGTGFVAVKSQPGRQVLLATGDCRVPMRLKTLEGGEGAPLG